MAADTPRPARIAAAGYLCGVAAVALAWTVAARPHGLFHLPALLAVFFAGAALTLIAARPEDLRSRVKQPDPRDQAEARARLLRLAATARTDGARGLERELPMSRHTLERQGLNLLVDGCAPAELQAALESCARDADQDDLAAARVWRLLSSSFLNAGIVVTLVGMVRTLLGDPAQAPAPEALAGALTAAIYGIVVGVGVLHPQVGRARHLARSAAACRRVWIEGLVAIADGVHPRRLADRWNMDSGSTPLLRRVA